MSEGPPIHARPWQLTAKQLAGSSGHPTTNEEPGRPGGIPLPGFPEPVVLAGKGGIALPAEGVPPKARQPTRNVLAQLEEEKSRIRSIDRGMTALVERAKGVPRRYASAEESIRKTLRRRGPSLHLTKTPLQRQPLYPRTHAAAAQPGDDVTFRSVQSLGIGFESSSLDMHIALQQQALQQSVDESYELHRWKPARRSTIMRRVEAVTLVPPPWKTSGADDQADQDEQGDRPMATRPRKRTPVWERLARSSTAARTSIAGAARLSRQSSRRAGGRQDGVALASSRASAASQAAAAAAARPLAYPSPPATPRTRPASRDVGGRGSSGAAAAKLSSGSAAGPSTVGNDPRDGPEVPRPNSNETDGPVLRRARMSTHTLAFPVRRPTVRMRPSPSAPQASWGAAGSQAGTDRESWAPKPSFAALTVARASVLYGPRQSRRSSGAARGRGSSVAAYAHIGPISAGADDSSTRGTTPAAGRGSKHSALGGGGGDGCDVDAGRQGDGVAEGEEQEKIRESSSAGSDGQWEAVIKGSASSWLLGIKSMLLDLQQATTTCGTPYLQSFVANRASRASRAARQSVAAAAAGAAHGAAGARKSRIRFTQGSVASAAESEPRSSLAPVAAWDGEPSGEEAANQSSSQPAPNASRPPVQPTVSRARASTFARPSIAVRRSGLPSVSASGTPPPAANGTAAGDTTTRGSVSQPRPQPHPPPSDTRPSQQLRSPVRSHVRLSSLPGIDASPPLASRPSALFSGPLASAPASPVRFSTPGVSGNNSSNSNTGSVEAYTPTLPPILSNPSSGRFEDVLGYGGKDPGQGGRPSLRRLAMSCDGIARGATPGGEWSASVALDDSRCTL